MIVVQTIEIKNEIMEKQLTTEKGNVLKGLKKYQREIIYGMAYDGLVIRIRFDHDKPPTITLEDENADDTYNSVGLKTMQAFKESKLMYFDSWTPALFMDVHTYRLKTKILKSIKKYGKY